MFLSCAVGVSAGVSSASCWGALFSLADTRRRLNVSSVAAGAPAYSRHYFTAAASVLAVDFAAAGNPGTISSAADDFRPSSSDISRRIQQRGIQAGRGCHFVLSSDVSPCIVTCYSQLVTVVGGGWWV